MKNIEYKILLVDDEQDVIEFLSYNLKKEGFLVYTANNGKDAIKIANKILPHLIILDIMMPDIDGVETCEDLRKIPKLNNTLIVFLTARGEDYSQIAGFDAGADDYITKPIKPKILISRVKALLKRNPAFSPSDISVNDNIINRGDIIIDKEKYEVLVKNKIIILPKKEYELLLLLVSKQEKVFTRDEIYSCLWGTDVIVGDRTIDVYIRKLREKIGEEHIITFKGIGYKFI